VHAWRLVYWQAESRANRCLHPPRHRDLAEVAQIGGDHADPVAIVPLQIGLDEVLGDERRLVLGAAADIGATTLYARIDDETAEPRVVTIRREALDSLASDPAAYISKTALTIPAADIRFIRIGAHLYERDLDRWSIDGVPATKDEARAIESMLHLLCESRATAVSLTTDATALATPIEVIALGGQPVATLQASRPSDARPDEIVLEAGSVMRRYAGESDAAAVVFKD